MIVSNTSSNAPKLIMDEWSSASCGGIVGISDTFGVGALWTVAYALQMASVGYSAAYIHTRERGISYNLFTPPDALVGPAGAWTTNPPYYALLTVAEALQSKNGAMVTDLNLNSSRTDINATVGGYAVFDAQDSSLQQIVLINYANASTATFALPASAFMGSGRSNVLVKYLSAPSVSSKSQISWGGETLQGVGDGTMVGNLAWAQANQNVDCSNGCNVNVPAPGLAVVFATGNNSTTTTDSTSAAVPLKARKAMGVVICLVASFSLASF